MMTTMTGQPANTPPKLLDFGHAKLTGQYAAMGGYVTMYLLGKPDRPQLRGYDPDSFGSYDIKAGPAELALFAREILRYLGEDYGIELPPWRPASDGAGKRPWFLARYTAALHDGAGIPVEDRFRYGTAGTLIRYATMAAAQRTADRLNASEAAA